MLDLCDWRYKNHERYFASVFNFGIETIIFNIFFGTNDYFAKYKENKIDLYLDFFLTNT